MHLQTMVLISFDGMLFTRALKIPQVSLLLTGERERERERHKIRTGLVK